VFLFVKPPDDAKNGSSLSCETMFLTLWMKDDARVDGSYSGAGPVVTTVEDGDSGAEDIPVVVAAATGIALAGLIYGAGTESGRYGLAGLFAPLYSRITGNKVLDNDVRDNIYQYILDNPGINFSSLMRELELKNGTLSHHLRTLERERFLVSRREGAYRRFYPRGIRVEAEERNMLNPLQKSILDYIKKHAGHNQSLIASEMDCSRQVVSYNIGILSGAGMIHVEKHGRKCFCYPAREVGASA
jgi:DNA-binding MarR family transcriptional regulator